MAERVYISVILPKLDYCDFAWNNLASSRYNTLKQLQTRAARIVLKESNLSHDQLLCEFSWKSIKARCTMPKVIFVFKCRLHSIAPDLFRDYFIRSSHNYNTRRNGVAR